MEHLVVHHEVDIKNIKHRINKIDKELMKKDNDESAINIVACSVGTTATLLYVIKKIKLSLKNKCLFDIF